jgi:geranylgeranyl reductase family protein
MPSFDYQVAVIGAGPSGASAAFELGKAGISTVIIEKKKLPRYKVCGGGLVYRGLKDLSFDITPVIEKQFNSIDVNLSSKLRFKTSSDQPLVTMIMRDTFDELLTKKAEEHDVTLLDEQKLTDLRFDNDSIVIKTDKNTLCVQAIIAADGAYSPTAKLAGWKEDTRTLIPALEYEILVTDAEFEKHKNIVRFDMDAVDNGYGWSFPKEKHLSVGVGGFGNKGKKLDLKTACAKYIKDIGINNIMEINKHGFNVPVTTRTDGFTRNGVFLIGDAAGFADPITAEGISNAIYSGRLAAQAIIESPGDLDRAQHLYLDKLNEDLLPQLATAEKLARWFYGNKKLRNILMRKYGQNLADYMADIFTGKRKYPDDVMKRLKQKLLTFG